MVSKKNWEKMDIENPVTFNEKIQLIKLYSKNNLMTKLCDKYLVRDWVAKKNRRTVFNTAVRSVEFI